MSEKSLKASYNDKKPVFTLKGKDICGAKRKKSEELCTRPAGWGTKHPGTGKCKFHGGCSTGPKDREKQSESQKGNSNGNKHGVFQKIVSANMTEEERQNFEMIPDIRDMKMELKILRYKLIRLLSPVERAQVVSVGDGFQEIQFMEIDEVTKSYAIERLIDGIRKVLRDMKDTEEEYSTFDKLLEQVAQMRARRQLTMLNEGENQ